MTKSSTPAFTGQLKMNEDTFQNFSPPRPRRTRSLKKDFLRDLRVLRGYNYGFTFLLAIFRVGKG